MRLSKQWQKRAMKAQAKNKGPAARHTSGSRTVGIRRWTGSSDRPRRLQEPVDFCPNPPFRQQFEAASRPAGSDYRADAELVFPKARFDFCDFVFYASVVHCQLLCGLALTKNEKHHQRHRQYASANHSDAKPKVIPHDLEFIPATSYAPCARVHGPAFFTTNARAQTR